MQRGDQAAVDAQPRGRIGGGGQRVGRVLARQQAATADVGFDDPPDGFLAVLRTP
jgi:hypothetical protein